MLKGQYCLQWCIHWVCREVKEHERCMAVDEACLLLEAFTREELEHGGEILSCILLHGHEPVDLARKRAKWHNRLALACSINCKAKVLTRGEREVERGREREVACGVCVCACVRVCVCVCVRVCVCFLSFLSSLPSPFAPFAPRFPTLAIKVVPKPPS